MSRTSISSCQSSTESAVQRTGLKVIHDENTGLVGIFLVHEQCLTLYNGSVDPLTPTKQQKLPGSRKVVDQQRQITYKLNSSLFAINEPYFMKTERDALLNMVKDSSKKKAVASKTEANLTPVEDKSAQNKSKKRKKSLTKKLTYIHSNLENDNERSIVAKLVKLCLNAQYDPETIVPSANTNGDSKFLAHIAAKWPSELSGSNHEAQTFVDSLFNNRFESLNYQSKVYCNPFDQVLKVKFGITAYLVPARCSFAGTDIVQGIQQLTRHFKISSVTRQENLARLVSTKQPFLVVIDPAWCRNKSVKRKKSYETVSDDYLRRMSTELKVLLELVTSLRTEIRSTNLKTKAQKTKNSQRQATLPEVIVAIWTTKADKDFVLTEMMPLMGIEQCSFDLKWHKVTIHGYPTKIHGGLEYLVVGHLFGNGKQSQTGNEFKSVKRGVLVSVPSAIHSHKPSLVPLMHTLYSVDADSTSSKSASSSSSSKRSLTLASEDVLYNHREMLVSNEMIAPMEGIELFARSLTTGFHSIGFECIKLQNCNLFQNN